MPFALTANHAHTHSTSGGGASLAFTSNVTQGNLLIAIHSAYAAGCSISTPFTNSGTVGVQDWQPLLSGPFSSSTAAATMQMWWAIASATGSCTCTATWTTTTLGVEQYVSEWTVSGVIGQVVQDGTGQTAQGTTASIVLPAIGTTSADALVFGYVSSANTGTVNSPWTRVDQDNGDEWFYQADLAAGTYTPSVSQTSGVYACVMAALGIQSPALPTANVTTSMRPRYR